MTASVSRRAAVSSYALASLGGVLVAVAIPPLGWWPLMLLGVACYLVAADRAPRRGGTQFVLATVFAWSWLAPADTVPL